LCGKEKEWKDLQKYTGLGIPLMICRSCLKKEEERTNTGRTEKKEG